MTPEPIKKPNDSPQYPAGLRLPTAQELAKEPARKESPTQNASVEADFNGDGKPDYAILLASINTNKGALAVKLSNPNNYEWLVSIITLIGMLNQWRLI
ncbi:hypothetical protein BCS42_07070 [Crenothrix sp. D3]|nr:hypothetical protein BCS42_07070 [Crenothrix sp. D3]